jgi:ribonuclease HI
LTAAGLIRTGVAGFAWLREGQKPHVEWGQDWTNNEAEFRAVLSAVKALPRGAEATVFCDSGLVVQQLRGKWQAHEPRLWDLLAEVEAVVFNNALRISWVWIPRNENKADRLLRRRPKRLEQSSCVPEPHKLKSQARMR